MKGKLSLDYLDNVFRQLWRFCRWSDIPIFDKKREMKKKQAKNWTRNVIYTSMFHVFHQTDVEMKLIFRFFIRKQKMTKKDANNWTRNVIFTSMLHVSIKQMLKLRCPNDSFLLYAGDFFFLIGAILHELFVVSLTVADLAMVMPSTTGNLLDFRLAEKVKLLRTKTIFVRAALVITTAVVSLSCNSSYFESSRKQIGQTVLHGPYSTLYWYTKSMEFS